MRSRLISAALAVAAVVLLLPLTAGAGSRDRDGDRLLFATDNTGKLLRFTADDPDEVWSRTITGLPTLVTLEGIDFRPATGDLYALGSDKVVYRVNPWTAIAVAEGPADAALVAAIAGDRLGFDFNPTVDKIRVTSDADDNLRADPDPGTLLANDSDLNPQPVTVVGSAYTNSSFTATRPTATALYAYDVEASPDRIQLQNPPNAGTLNAGVGVKANLGSDLGFDIAGSDNDGFVAGTPAGKKGARLYQVDVLTGQTRQLGRIDGGVTITGLAAVQDGVGFARMR